MPEKLVFPIVPLSVGLKSGKIQGRQMDTGTILITEPIGEPQIPERSMKVAIYTRVSAA